MSNVLKLKRSSTAASVPTTSDLVDSEPAVNTADQRLFVRMGSDIVAFAPELTYEEKTASFTAAYGYRYDLHNTANLTVTLPTWVQNGLFELTLDGDAKNHTLTFTYRTGEDINGSAADGVASTKETGDVFVVRAMGDSGDKHWSITRQAAI